MLGHGLNDHLLPFRGSGWEGKGGRVLSGSHVPRSYHVPVLGFRSERLSCYRKNSEIDHGLAYFSEIFKFSKTSGQEGYH